MSDWKKGREIYDKFMKKEKSKGTSHKDALALWKESKSSIQQSPSSKVSGKPTKPKKSTSKKQKRYGFQRPAKLWDKLHRQTSKSRLNITAIKKSY